MSYLVKLVRDAIPGYLGGDGTITYREVDRDAHVALLRRKLIEEAAEYLTNPCVEEAADVLAVLRALAIVDLEVPWPDVQQAEADKHGTRGGFTSGVGMYAAHSVDGQEASRVAS